MDGRETMSRPYFLNEKSNRQVLILELDSLTSLKQIFISMAHLAPSPKSHSTSRQTTKLDDEKVCCCPYLFFSHSHLFWCVSFFFFLGWRGGQYMSAVAAARREPASPRTSSSIPSPLSPLGTPIFSLFRKSQKIVNASHKRHAPTPTSTSPRQLHITAHVFLLSVDYHPILFLRCRPSHNDHSVSHKLPSFSATVANNAVSNPVSLAFLVFKQGQMLEWPASYPHQNPPCPSCPGPRQQSSNLSRCLDGIFRCRKEQRNLRAS